MRDRTVVHGVDAGVGAARRGVRQVEKTPLIGIGCTGTGRVIHAADSTGTSPQKLRRVPFLRNPEVGSLVAQVAYRSHPTARELPLVGDVPLSYVRGRGIERHVDVRAKFR